MNTIDSVFRQCSYDISGSIGGIIEIPDFSSDVIVTAVIQLPTTAKREILRRVEYHAGDCRSPGTCQVEPLDNRN